MSHLHTDKKSALFAIDFLLNHYNHGHQPVVNGYTTYTQTDIAKELACINLGGFNDTFLDLTADLFYLLKDPDFLASELIQHGVAFRHLDFDLAFMLLLLSCRDYNEFLDRCDDELFDAYFNCRYHLLYTLGDLVLYHELHGVTDSVIFDDAV